MEDQVDNFGSTTSNDITFEFSGTTNDDDIIERGFICELDEEVIINANMILRSSLLVVKNLTIYQTAPTPLQ